MTFAKNNEVVQNVLWKSVKVEDLRDKRIESGNETNLESWHGEKKMASVASSRTTSRVQRGEPLVTVNFCPLLSKSTQLRSLGLDGGEEKAASNVNVGHCNQVSFFFLFLFSFQTVVAASSNRRES